MTIIHKKTGYYYVRKRREINAEIYSQNTGPVGGPIHWRGEILISFLDTVCVNMWKYLSGFV